MFRPPALLCAWSAPSAPPVVIIPWPPLHPHNLPPNTSDSFGILGALELYFSECGGYSHCDIGVPIGHQGWLAGQVSPLFPTALYMPPLVLQDRRRRNQGWRRQPFRQGEVWSSVKAEGVAVFPARIPSPPRAPVSLSIERGDETDCLVCRPAARVQERLARGSPGIGGEVHGLRELRGMFCAGQGGKPMAQGSGSLKEVTCVPLLLPDGA